MTTAPENTSLHVPADPKRVFVIHGRNDRLRQSMFEFLRALGLVPIEWGHLIHESSSRVPYVGQVLDIAFDRAAAVVALLTPDDLAHLRPDLQHAHDASHEIRPTGQARPNVLFETGMAFGRAQDRTVIVEIGDLRPFSDVSGRHVVRLTNEPGQLGVRS